MAKPNSSLVNMILSLSLISAVMSAALGVTYLLTKETIENVEKDNTNKAIQVVVPKFDNVPYTEQTKINNGKDTFLCYTARKGNCIVGYAVKSYTEKGFGGHISVMVGFLPDGAIYNTSVLEHKETPGLGTNMMSAKFKNQFNQKNPQTFNLTVKKDGGDVDAITAATISSRAFCDAINSAYAAVKTKIVASADTLATTKGELK